MENIEGIADRIRLILKVRGWSERTLSIKAGKAHSQVNWTLKSLANDAGSVTLGTLIDIADGAGVSLRWLLHGEGPMDAEPDPYPERIVAATFARANRVREDAIREISLVVRSGPPLSPEEWYSRMKSRALELEELASDGPLRPAAPETAPASTMEPRTQRMARREGQPRVVAAEVDGPRTTRKIAEQAPPSRRKPTGKR
jgi:transcriptional regulator with XRE-family HTH domain